MDSDFPLLFKWEDGYAESCFSEAGKTPANKSLDFVKMSKDKMEKFKKLKFKGKGEKFTCRSLRVMDFLTIQTLLIIVFSFSFK